ncbi:MAG: hypothetical protein ACOY4R_27590 [Pseudomonadota bacterium]
MTTIDVTMPDGSVRAFLARPPRDDEPYFQIMALDLVPDSAEWEFSIGYDTWRAVHADGWYTHPALPTALIRRAGGVWRLYTSPHSSRHFAGGFGPASALLERVNPALMPAWRAAVSQ